MERRLILAIALLAILAIATQVLVWVFAPREGAAAFTGPPRSDYTLLDYSIDALDAKGQHSFSVAGPRLVRRAQDGSIFATTPRYEILDGSRNVWQGTSDAAWVNKDGTLMKLDGKVDMHRLPTASATAAKLLTSDLTIASTGKGHAVDAAADKTLQTAALATLTDPGHVMHGVGMRADLGLKTVELLSDVNAILLPSRHETHE